jgi:hypothetical protein
LKGSSWTKGVIIDPHSLSAISCATATFCVAVDTVGKVVEWTGSTWSAPPVANTNGLNAVSCPTVSFCVAGGSGGYAITWNGTSWSAATVIDDSGAGYIGSISCPSSSFCEAFDDVGYYVTWNGSTWSAPARLDGMTTGQSTFGNTSVDCPSSQYCMLVTSYQLAGQNTIESYWTWNGSGWSGPYLLNPHVGSIAGVGSAGPGLSCVSFSYCVLVGAGDSANVASTWDGTSWSLPLVLGEVNGYQFGTGNMFGGGIYISCPTSSFCASSDGGSVVAFEQNDAWSPGWQIDGAGADGIDGLSCASSSFCVAIDGSGGAVVYQSGTWGPRAQVGNVAEEPFSLQAVSCVSASFCVTFGGDGTESTWNGSNWSVPVLVDDIAMPASVSCPSTSFCMMVDGSGYQSTWNGTTWSNPSHFVSGTPDTPNSVSCSTTTSCVVTTFDQGYLFAWNGSRWSGPVTAGGDDSEGGVGVEGGGVSCASPKFCYLYQDTYAGTTASAVWNGSKVIPITTGQPLWDASCYAVGRCVGVGGLYYGFYVEISSPPLAVTTTASLPGGTVGTAYSTPLKAKGGNAPFTWAVTTGSLPPGLALSNGGVISGKPTTTGTSQFTVTVTDSSNPAQTASRTFSLSIS